MTEKKEERERGNIARHIIYNDIRARRNEATSQSVRGFIKDSGDSMEFGEE